MEEKKKYKISEEEKIDTVLEDPAVVSYDGGVWDISLRIPKSDIKFLNELIKKMGWTINSKDGILEEFLSSRPKDVDLSENEIMEEVRLVRYKK